MHGGDLKEAFDTVLKTNPRANPLFNTRKQREGNPWTS